MSKELFGEFDSGKLCLPKKVAGFASIAWSKHTVFRGVELKHIVTSIDTGGLFSCHLVKIAPYKSIGLHIHECQLEIHEVIAGSGACINNGAEIEYQTGVISIFEKGTKHEVKAGGDGLYLFAKFIPALC